MLSHLHKAAREMSALLSLERFLTCKLELQRQGGHVFIRDDNTLILSDRLVFTNDHYKLVSSKFPHVHIDVVGSSGSKSGFFVLFSCPSQYNSAWQRSFVLLGMHATIFVATVACTLGHTVP